ncbi:MAG: cyclic nucleotide-binding domain-containing protein [Betaproteobacteria bacterium]
MTQDLEVGTGFEVSTANLRALGVTDPYSAASLQAYKSGTLSSDERLYFTLWGSRVLKAVVFDAKRRVVQAGHPAHAAYFIVSGKLLAVEGKKVHRIGPGGVIGVAEAVAGLPYGKSYVTVEAVEARVVDVSSIAAMIRQCPPGLRGLIRTITMRTLGIKEIPEVLK